jgi:hypothetical protein
VAVLAETGSGVGTPLAPPTAAAAAAVAATTQLMQLYLVCGVIGHELARGCMEPERDVVLRALLHTYVGRGPRDVVGSRAARLVASRLAVRVGINLIPVVNVAECAFVANQDLRHARAATRRLCRATRSARR